MKTNNEMVENTKLAAFFLWEYSGYQNTLALWYCTEDIASFFDRCQVYTVDDIYEILRLNRGDPEYKAFVRHIAYRIHLYTGMQDDGFNWYTAERLLNNAEYREAIVFLAAGLRSMRDNTGEQAQGYKILSPTIKNYYNA